MPGSHIGALVLAIVGLTVQVTVFVLPSHAAEPTESLAGDDRDEDAPEDPDIEVIKVRGGPSADFDDIGSGDSIAAFDSEDLEALGVQNLADLASFTPNLEIVTTGATTPTFFIRGVGLNVFNPNSSGAVAVTFNGVTKNSAALQLGTLFDVEKVNVLRGPQGSGNLRGASAGAINTYSRKPTGKYNATLRQSYGNYDAVDLEGAIGAPVYEDVLAARIAFRFSDHHGYGRNGCGDLPAREERAIRPARGVTQSTDPRWSLCGDDVPFEGARILGVDNGVYDGRSLVPEGLPTKLNNQHNWAARGTLFFQPTLDQEWLLIASGSRRDELSRQGQSHGTNRAGDSLIGAFGTGGRGMLGSIDGSSYIPAEVERQRWKIDPCRNDDTGGTFDDEGNSLCLGGDGRPDRERVRTSDSVSRFVLAKDLARNLDSEPYRGDYNAPGSTKLETWGVSLQGDLVFAESFVVKTVTGFDSYSRSIAVDLDQSPNTNFETNSSDDGWQFVQSLEVRDTISENIPIEWRVGSLLLHEQITAESSGNFSGANSILGVSSRQYRQKLWSLNTFGEFTFSFWEKFALDMGFRFNWDYKSMDYLLERGPTQDYDLFADKDWMAPTGTIRLTYSFTETSTAYWKYSRGWKGGHYNATGGSDGVFAAKPEQIDSFEFGVHGNWMSGLLAVDFALFHYNYVDYQLATTQQRFDGFPEFVVINADNSEVYGAEADIALRPLPGMLLIARLAWLQSQFLDYTQIQVERVAFGFGNQAVVNNEIQNTGEPLINSPNFKVSLTAQQSVPIGRLGTLTARWDGAWTDDIFYDATQSRGIPNLEGDQFLPKYTIGQRAHWRHNVRLGYRTPNGQIEVAGWVRNVTDQVYKTYAFDASSVNGTTIFFLGTPRMYGVSLSTSY